MLVGRARREQDLAGQRFGKACSRARRGRCARRPSSARTCSGAMYVQRSPCGSPPISIRARPIASLSDDDASPEIDQDRVCRPSRTKTLAGFEIAVNDPFAVNERRAGAADLAEQPQHLVGERPLAALEPAAPRVRRAPERLLRTRAVALAAFRSRCRQVGNGGLAALARVRPGPRDPGSSARNVVAFEQLHRVPSGRPLGDTLVEDAHHAGILEAAQRGSRCGCSTGARGSWSAPS